MKKILFTLVFTLFYLPLCGFSQSDIHTPNKSEPAAFKLAKVYFLPDWSDKKMSFDGTDEKPCTEICPQKTSYDCASGQTETYTNSCGMTCTRCVECYGCDDFTLISCPADAYCGEACCNGLFRIEYCNSGYVLENGTCRAETCSDNPNICSGGKSCVSGTCQCPSGQTDVGGKCETSTCKNGGIICSGSAGVCNETTGKCVQCMTNSDCGGGKECNANNQCIAPDACAGVTCGGGKSCVDGTCVCPSGQVDNNGICETPNCANGGPACPDGQTCNQTTKVCETTTRDCQLADIFYTDETCSNAYISGKTPVGVVIDPANHLLVDITEVKGVMATSDMPGYSQINYLSDELPINASESGVENTQKIISATYGESQAKVCTQKGSYFYVPATREIYRLVNQGNLEKINATLQMLSQHISSAKIISNKIWSSNEARNTDGYMLVYDPQSSSSGLTPMPKDASDVYFRCMMRYGCLESNPDCEIKPLIVGSNPINEYISGEAQCVSPYELEIFDWGTSYYTRGAWYNRASDGSDGDDTQKIPCQTEDCMYCKGKDCFCTRNSCELNYKGYTKMGRVGKQGLIILGEIGSPNSVADAENACNSYSREGFSDWRIPYTTDVNGAWNFYILYASHPYAKNGSFSYYWDGNSWNMNVSNNRWGTLYSDIYQE